MNKLSWIDDDSLRNAVLNMLQRAQDAKSKAATRIRYNVIDPFSSLVLAASIDDISKNTLSSIQEITSASSGISSAVGDFYQKILGCVDGFINHDAGYDLECVSRQILAEVKNKHNTVNSTSREKTVEDLDTAVRQKQGNWTAYLVFIIPKKPIRYKKKISTNRKVYEIDGASFYELATGSATALHDLYYAAAEIAAEDRPYMKAGKILQYCESALKNGIPK